jgi:hypothetical protein
LDAFLKQSIALPICPKMIQRILCLTLLPLLLQSACFSLEQVPVTLTGTPFSAQALAPASLMSFPKVPFLSACGTFTHRILKPMTDLMLEILHETWSLIITAKEPEDWGELADSRPVVWLNHAPRNALEARFKSLDRYARDAVIKMIISGRQNGLTLPLSSLVIRSRTDNLQKMILVKLILYEIKIPQEDLDELEDLESALRFAHPELRPSINSDVCRMRLQGMIDSVSSDIPSSRAISALAKLFYTEPKLIQDFLATGKLATNKSTYFETFFNVFPKRHDAERMRWIMAFQGVGKDANNTVILPKTKTLSFLGINNRQFLTVKEYFAELSELRPSVPVSLDAGSVIECFNDERMIAPRTLTLKDYLRPGDIVRIRKNPKPKVSHPSKPLKKKSLKPSLNTSPLEPIQIIFVHGTWAPKSMWTQPGSSIRTYLETRFPNVDIMDFVWTGDNSHKKRMEAFWQLTGAIAAQTLTGYKPARFIIAHSHGGNLLLGVLRNFGDIAADLVAGVITFSTPFIQSGLIRIEFVTTGRARDWIFIAGVVAVLSPLTLFSHWGWTIGILGTLLLLRRVDRNPRVAHKKARGTQVWELPFVSPHRTLPVPLLALTARFDEAYLLLTFFGQIHTYAQIFRKLPTNPSWLWQIKGISWTFRLAGLVSYPLRPFFSGIVFLGAVLQKILFGQSIETGLHLSLWAQQEPPADFTNRKFIFFPPRDSPLLRHSGVYNNPAAIAHVGDWISDILTSRHQTALSA